MKLKERFGSADAVPELVSKWMAAVVLGLLGLAILAVISPSLIVADNTPTGGDMGAHVYAPAFLRDVLLGEFWSGSFRIMGWSNGWYAGFPIFYFYFPLPALVTVMLDTVLPYGVAFKMVSVAGLVSLPAASFFLARCMRFSRVVSLAVAAGGGAYVFMDTPVPNIFGGTIASTLAGQFSYGWAFSLALLYLGFAIKAVYEDRKWVPAAAAALAATALCHIIPVMGVVAASLVLIPAVRLRVGDSDEVPGWLRSGWSVVASWLIGFGLVAFWALPLAARIGFTYHMNWYPLTGLGDLLPGELVSFLVLGMLGMLWGVRRSTRVLPFVVLTLLPLPLFFLLQQGSPLWNGRALPHWFFGLHWFAGLGVGLAAEWVAARLRDRVVRVWFRPAAVLGVLLLAVMSATSNPVLIGWLASDTETGWWRVLLGRVSRMDVVMVLVMVFAMIVITGVGVAKRRGLVAVAAVLLMILPPWMDSRSWDSFVSAQWNYEGYEAKQGWPVYTTLMEVMDSLPPGRVHWEATNEYDLQFGTPMALMLLPYWTEGSHPSMEGLFFESSVTTPFHFLVTAETSARPSNPIPGLLYSGIDLQRGAQHLRLFNVTYFVAYSDEVKSAADQVPSLLTPLVDVERFRVYQVAASNLVDVAVKEPWVLAEPDGLFSKGVTFEDAAISWFYTPYLLDQWVAEDGPESWVRVRVGDLPEQRVLGTGGHYVYDVELEDHRIAFSTTAVGVPHLVKVSYFPNWKAYGAEGPWRVTPAFMLVIPTEERVELKFRNTWAEWLGLLVTLVTVVWFVRRGRGRDMGDLPVVGPVVLEARKRGLWVRDWLLGSSDKAKRG